MFCKNCGSAIGDQAAFCPKCGTKVQNTAQPVQTAKPALNIKTDTTAILSYAAAGCSALAAIFWGFIGKDSTSMYEKYIEPSSITFLSVLIIAILAISAIAIALPQLGLLNTGKPSQKTLFNIAAITSVVGNVFAFFIVHGYRSSHPNYDLGDLNAFTFLFFIAAWAGLVLTLKVYSDSRKGK